MAQVVIRLLGGFSVDIDGLTVTAASFERRIGAELVQLLALAPNHRLHREQVLDSFWPEVDRSAAMKRLNKAATFARNATGHPTAIVVAGETLELFPDHDRWIDIDVVSGADLDDPEDVAAAALAANGELLPDAPYAEWTTEARNRLKLRQIELLRAAGEWDRILDLDPLDESAHLALMRAALERGDRDAVLQRYDVLDELLGTELGVVPSEAAVSLRDQARQTDPAAPSSNVRTEISAFLFTDIEGSTRRWEAEPGSAEAVLRHHDAVLSDALQRVGGTVFKHTGDGLCASFPSAMTALEGAIEGQRALQGTSWPGQDRPRVRMGIDLGEAVRRGDDWSGKPLNRAARIMGACSGDQILCSAVVAELAALEPSTTLELADLGLFRLPDLPPQRLFRVTAPGLEAATAPPRSMRMVGRQLPPPRSRTFGRADERDTLARVLSEERVVTLTGPGGAGKTHLALDIAASIVDEFTGGGWLCELGKVSSSEAAAQEILSGVGGLRHGSTSVLDSVVAVLGQRHNLVVLDNCEHVLDGVRPIVSRIIDDCPQTTILASSREPLAVHGERVVRIEPLDRAAAVALFAAEATRHGSNIDGHDDAIQRICQRLDDLPLAIRLAAARARSVDLTTLESLLSDRFDHLSQLEPDGLEHQQTLSATIAWSVDSLDRPLRMFLSALSVFADRFELDDITAVTGDPAGSVLAMLDALVQRSLIIGPERTPAGPQYRLLESVRLYLRASLTDEIRHRHIDHVVKSVATWNRQIGAKDNLALRRFAARWDDIRLAVQNAIELDRRDDAIEILSSTGLYGNVAMRFEMLDWYEQVLDPDATRFRSRAEARTHAGWSVLATYHGNFELAARLGNAVIGTEPDLAEGAWAKAWLPWTRGDLAEARSWLDRILDNDDPEALLVKFGAMHLRSIVDFASGADIGEAAHLLDVLSVGLGASARALALATRGLHGMWTDGEAALADAEECIALADRFGVVNASMTGRSIRALATAVHGTEEEALRIVAETQAYAAERGLWSWVLAGLGTASAVFERVGRPDVAATLLGARQGADYRSGFTASLALLQEDRLRRDHPEAFEGWWRAGHHLAPPEAGALAVRRAEELLSGP